MCGNLSCWGDTSIDEYGFTVSLLVGYLSEKSSDAYTLQYSFRYNPWQHCLKAQQWRGVTSFGPNQLDTVLLELWAINPALNVDFFTACIFNVWIVSSVLCRCSQCLVKQHSLNLNMCSSDSNEWDSLYLHFLKTSTIIGCSFKSDFFFKVVSPKAYTFWGVAATLKVFQCFYKLSSPGGKYLVEDSCSRLWTSSIMSCLTKVSWFFVLQNYSIDRYWVINTFFACLCSRVVSFSFVGEGWSSLDDNIYLSLLVILLEKYLPSSSDTSYEFCKAMLNIQIMPELEQFTAVVWKQPWFSFLYLWIEVAVRPQNTNLESDSADIDYVNNFVCTSSPTDNSHERGYLSELKSFQAKSLYFGTLIRIYFTNAHLSS